MPQTPTKPRLKPIAVEAPQRSEEWHKARLGKVTGSMASATMAYYVPYKKDIELAEAEHQSMGTPPEIIEKLKELYPSELIVSAGLKLTEKSERINYRQNIVAERLTGVPADPDPYVTYDMKWGIVNEDIAKAVYQMQFRRVIEEAPFLLHPELKCGASPDGFATDLETGEVGNIEVKCLRSANHLYKIMKDGTVPQDYIPQIQMQMWINGADWCDFMGFDSRVPEGLKIHVQRVMRDDFYIDYVLEPAVTRFLDECDNDFKHFWAKVKQPSEAQNDA